ncbi:UDP-N-acetylmuramoyl-tripeptide--D-alanyl-D-alanine ligase [Wolbachia endosymbiont of Dirofilaria (Dirofilaria) immitis]|uniref:UDP-N-acetylmuramoyl-tripeptide--D-alanyl-D- alanine ligase n=1 Tax=Wolbachia endosymbiont of Dirofilaria (Dirofilaria) immitis TaxID=1812115 RepID=UPI00158ED018|nr:UDP-N-acetylmuramoyl-tripeptide--D-alanyl-D-alanine ligase [Wolbachia endosymbiont of Dirofilaria (Dirofilaria) immitis]QKX02411.1 UDP-N-acetylmuramoyl-tripeptide--D-alanyl-D-alanine ligase [Wolbachia endosymbiont of Dirofilaria (Dirofilaria) immitis]
MFKWNTNNIIDATNGRKEGSCNWTHSSNISIDTRSIKKGDVFIALKGKKFDGHDFLHEAFLKGAKVAIVSDNKYKNLPLILVQDTLKSLHNIASYYVRNVLVNTKIIAITGSIGKTTTKDMLHIVLSQYGISYATEGNLNNNVGLPLTILKAPENCQYLILEMGMNKTGEIKELSKISNPDIAVITNVEPTHVENFSSLFDIAQAKLEVLHGMKTEGTLVLNKDNKYYNYLSSYANKNVVSFGKDKNATVCLLDITENNESSIITPASHAKNQATNRLGLKIRLNNNQIINCNLHLRGEHFAYSALTVIAIIQILGLDLSKLLFALENFSVTKGRGSVHKAKYNENYVYLIDDSYNASPASMKAAIKTLGTYSNQRKVALLGDMLELGNESITFHKKLLDSIIEHSVDKVYTVGKFMLELNSLLPGNIKGIHFSDINQLKSNLANIIQDNDIILIKGSRGVKMNLVVQEFAI